MCEALSVIEGTYGIAVIDLENPTQMVAARNGSPVVIGIGEHEHFVASDVNALIRYTQQIAYLDDGEIAVLERDQFRTLSIEGTERTKGVETVDWSATTYEKGEHAHYLRKEIFEQPESVRRPSRGASSRVSPRPTSAGSSSARRRSCAPGACRSSAAGRPTTPAWPGPS